MIEVKKSDIIIKNEKRGIMELENRNDVEINREALIAYVYDVYSVEQAIDATNKNINKLYKEKDNLKSDEQQVIDALSQKYDKKISETDSKFKSIPYDDNDIKLAERKKTIIASCAWIIFLVISYFILSNTNSNLAYEILVPALLLALLAIMFIAMREADSISKTHRMKVDKVNSGNRDKIDKQINSLENYKGNEIFTTQEKFNSQVKAIDKKISTQFAQKDEFERIRFNLYNELLLIPKPHQNLSSVCYLYNYLITSKETDLKYIFTQLYLQKIEDKLSLIIELEKKIIINQNLILAELKKHTQLLQSIDNNVSSFKMVFSQKMDEIRADLGEISDNQRSMLENQAVMYNMYMRNALKSAQNDEEKNEYLKMIANNSKVSAMFERADFLGLEMNRNWSGDY